MTIFAQAPVDWVNPDEPDIVYITPGKYYEVIREIESQGKFFIEDDEGVTIICLWGTHPICAHLPGAKKGWKRLDTGPSNNIVHMKKIH